MGPEGSLQCSQGPTKPEALLKFHILLLIMKHNVSESD